MCFVTSFFISEELTGEIYWPNYLLSHCEDEGCWQDHNLLESRETPVSRTEPKTHLPASQWLWPSLAPHQSIRKRWKGKARLILWDWKWDIWENKSRNGIYLMPLHVTIWENLLWRVFGNSSDQLWGSRHGLGSGFIICGQNHFVVAALGF